MGEDEGRRTGVGPPALVADLHLAPERDADAAGLGRLLERVAEWTDRLFILGDLFDYWVGPGMERLAAVQPHLRTLAESSLEITFLPGNRDFLAGPSFLKAAGLRGGGEEVTVTDPAGRRLLLLHGDQLCTGDLAYQRVRRVLRSGLLAALVPLVPFALRLRMARWLRRRSTASIARRQAWNVRPTAEAVGARLHDRGVEGLFCGHIHRPLRGGISAGEGVALHVLPAWCATGGWVLLAEEGPRLMDGQGREMTWPDPEELD